MLLPPVEFVEDDLHAGKRPAGFAGKGLRLGPVLLVARHEDDVGDDQSDRLDAVGLWREVLPRGGGNDVGARLLERWRREGAMRLEIGRRGERDRPLPDGFFRAQEDLDFASRWQQVVV